MFAKNEFETYSNLENNLKDALNILNSEQQSNVVIEEMYYNTAKNIGSRLNISSYDQLTEKLSMLGLGQVRVNLISEEKIIIRLYECFTCSSMDYIGKNICHFEAGIISGAVSTIINQEVEAVETRCCGLGDNFCEFELIKDSQLESKKKISHDISENETNVVDLTLHSLNLAKKYKEAEYKTECFSNVNNQLDKALKNVKEINEFNETVLDSIPNCLAVIDSNGVVTKINDNYLEFLGKNIYEVEKRSIKNLNWQTKYQEVLNSYEPAVWKESNDQGAYIVFETPLKEEEGVIRQLIPVESQFIKLLLDKMTFLEKEMKYYKNKVTEQKNKERLIDNMIVTSDKMKEIIKYAKKVAKTDATVLLRGESGTGKTMLAKRMHQEGPRSHNSFLYIDCTTIPENFFEAELFGYESGAFTGAKRGGKVGKIEEADGGTVFLDEIAEVPIKMQAKLLRFLQEQKFERIGSTETKEVDVRIIAATNQDLEAMVKEGRFRKDLYYRLNVINITLPSLSERWQDIPSLVDDILLQFSKEAGINIKEINEEGMKELIDYSWPGNIRELENVLKRLMIATEDRVIKKNDILEELKKTDNHKEVEELKYDIGDEGEGKIKLIEKELIIKYLKEDNHNKTKVANKLGISRQTLYNKLNKYDIDY
ncbi:MULTISPECIES: sigma 54-interacting transcriptional regulator [unclassified Candidatus Frackibacter]|uniref:sigma 54-interacting transcriptional regulator n=1 Tax=unclassified Candidatus Frackibacter TaxID=2648818 RepID=UPI000795B7E7|nr:MULTISPECIES: sigma 54-interacting transcriptional regulator [unclassified Candidatus Frackibacter]KXS40731.1 MAG: sigma-54 dependent transcription regulator [Candidatus Frackibacter sp. T328-2]SDC38399.1 Transcriptional regulator containing PAS, AAA-type ATPase, and DNA-binding Fis domains [Candidatus Frackibacter sp. WG11]SEM61897.1 Transcriptional regulator containing PAS, AAA-type ATPase, and DNA-binding Fis domains [Candidatus Frackibacter sp. WG12]SFL66079.1 Transcriptional regulator c